MTRVGTFEAKTHLTQLLDRVARGEKFLITNRGRPAAMLVPPEAERQVDVAGLVQEIRCRDEQGPTLGKGLSIRRLREEGREVLMARRRGKPARQRRFVIDCSVVLAWYFSDEASRYADSVAAALPRATAVVPCLFHLEIANILVVGERRQRSTEAQASAFLARLAGLPIVIDGQTEARAWSDTIALARSHGLSTYDASYLELAARESIPLATLDDRLEVAAKALGIPRFEP